MPPAARTAPAMGAAVIIAAAPSLSDEELDSLLCDAAEADSSVVLAWLDSLSSLPEELDALPVAEAEEPPDPPLRSDERLVAAACAALL